MNWINEHSLTGIPSIDSDSERRNSIIDSLRGILILLVVIRHALQFSVEDEGGIFTNIIWAVQMPGFFCISGFLSFHEKSPKRIGKTAIWKKVKRCLIPFMSWFVFVDVLLTGKDKNLVRRFSYLMYHMDAGLWFLWVLFFLSVLGLLLETVRQKGFSVPAECLMMGALVALYLAILAAAAKLNGSLAFLGIKYVLYYSTFYLIGYLFHYVIGKRGPLPKAVSDAASMIAMLVFCGIVFNYDLYASKDDLLSIMLRFIAGVCGTAALLHIVSYYDCSLRQHKVDRLGQYSLEVYVTHIHVCYLLNHHKAATLFSMEGVLTFIVSFSLTMLLTALLIRIIHAFPSVSFLFYGDTERALRRRMIHSAEER